LISRVNCTEITEDRPKQPAYKIFIVKRKFNSVSYVTLANISRLCAATHI